MGMEGRGWQKAASTPPCPAWSPYSPGLLQLCRALGGGQGLSPQTRGQSSGLGEAVLGESTHCSPAPRQGCPITWEEWGLSPMGHSHLGWGVPAWWGVAGGTRARMSWKHSAQRWHRSSGDKGLRIFPTAWARVALGPRGLHPALTHTCAPCPLPSPTLTWRRQLLGPTYLLAPGKAPCSHELGCPGSLPAPTYSHWMCRCWLHPSLLGVPGRSSSSGSGGVTPAGAVTMSMATILSPRVRRVELRGSARGAEMGWRVTD